MKKCPYCAEEIQDEAIKCRFCGSMLKTAEGDLDPSDDHAVTERAIWNLIKRGDKIGAIKLVMEKKNLGLKEAKDYVEGLDSGSAVAVPYRFPETANKKSNPLAAIIGVVVLIAGFGWIGGLFSTTDSSGRFVMPQSIVAPAPIVTMSEFNRIQEGMAYSEVSLIIGAAGQVLSQSDVAGFKTVMYSWSNSNGSNMNAMFQNGKLISKAQFGLP